MDWRRFTLSVEGAVLAGESRGKSPALCFVHGMAGERGDWDRLIAELPADLALLRHDMRGFGRSTAEQGVAFSHSEDLLAILDSLGIERIVPVGLSMGGGVALNFALNHPGRVEKLVLVSPAMVGWQWSDEWIALWRAVSKSARGGDLDLARQLWFDHPMFAEVRKGPLAGEFREAVAAYHGDQWKGSDERPELPDVDRLPGLDLPVLLLSGGRDVADMRLIADVIAGSAPRVTRVDFADAGHMLHIERPREVARAIVEFIGA